MHNWDRASEPHTTRQISLCTRQLVDDEGTQVSRFAKMAPFSSNPREESESEREREKES